MRTVDFTTFKPGEVTFGIIKPDAIRQRHEIVKFILQAKLDVTRFQLVELDEQDCEFLYYEHKNKPFYRDLADFMKSGPCVILMIAGENAISGWRELMGATDSSKADPMTIRSLFGDFTCIRRNAVHGSDSISSAKAELLYFFGRN